jgi:hypothetical protein
MIGANYGIVASNEKRLLIRDLGPWDKFQSVTNAAESVVEELVIAGRLLPNQKLLYYDSEGRVDELLVKDGKFAGFAPGMENVDYHVKDGNAA